MPSVFMSSPDELIRLKSKVETLEKEVEDDRKDSTKKLEAVLESTNPSDLSFKIITLLDTMKLKDKLLEAYREYVTALEMVAPRS